jgi:hypothetical protein
MIEGRYLEKLREFEEKQKVIEKRYAKFNARRMEVRKHERDTRRREKEIQELEEAANSVAYALGKSQAELETLDLIATTRTIEEPVTSKSRSRGSSQCIMESRDRPESQIW